MQCRGEVAPSAPYIMPTVSDFVTEICDELLSRVFGVLHAITLSYIVHKTISTSPSSQNITAENTNGKATCDVPPHSFMTPFSLDIRLCSLLWSPPISSNKIANRQKMQHPPHII